MRTLSKWLRSGPPGAMVALALLAPPSASGETVFVEAGADATLIEDPIGALANGSGPVFFVGRTNQREDSVRRGLIYFDVASVLPANAIVESVRLTLYMTPSNSDLVTIGLHRLLGDWGEGPSSASGGSGAPSLPGDVTWIHAFYDDDFWPRPGGHFVARESASRQVEDSAFYTWESTAKLEADVRLWLAAPHRNFGWVLMGDETTAQNAKSFASREEADASLWPLLEVTYRLAGP